MAKVLFLAHRYPYPPNKGDKIRAFHIAEHLRKTHEVSLGFVVTPGDNEPDLAWATKYFSAHYCGRISRADRLMRAGVAFATGAPLSVATFRHGGLMSWVAAQISEKKPQFIFVFSSAMAQYVPRDLPSETRVILDFVDVDSAKWRQYAEMQTIGRRWFFRSEAKRLLRFDRAAAAHAHVSLFVSEDEKRIFDRLSPETAAKHVAIGNGVDLDFFDPDALGPVARPRKTIVFVGMMDYWPNIDAVVWFAKDIFPLVRLRHGNAIFQIVGARPSAAVTALGALPGVEVTGAIPDVRPYVAAASVVVAPLRIARGIQNKVLEGMAMARPVVATPGALEGIGAVHGRDVLVGGNEHDLATAVVRILDGAAPSSLGKSARAFALRYHDWDTNLASLDAIFRLEGEMSTR